jgi:hypothetical protein
VTVKKIALRDPWAPPEWEPADAAALQALEQGVADEYQQKRALSWIINNCARTYDLEYNEDPRSHAFASGMRNVGLSIVNLLKISLPVLLKK